MFKFYILKSLIQKINIIKSKKNLLNSLNPGDLVWAKMPLSKKRLNNIEKSHQIRPYLVVHKDKFNIYAYQSSSKRLDKIDNCQKYCIHKIKYKKNKDSFINLTTIHKILFFNLKDKYITLDERDLQNIQKRLLIQKEKCIYKFETEIHIEEGDVIRVDNQLYFVYASDNVYLYCLSIIKKYPKDNKEKYLKIIINRKTYYTTFREKVDFKRTKKIEIVNIAEKVEIEKILKNKRNVEYREKLANIRKKVINKKYNIVYEKGTVFKVGRNKIVYLFEYKGIQYGIDLLMYQIKPKVIPIFDIEKREILEVLSLEEYIRIIEFLSSRNVQQLKEINRLYNELRIAIYD